jgi:hypothetical protein
VFCLLPDQPSVAFGQVDLARVETFARRACYLR